MYITNRILYYSLSFNSDIETLARPIPNIINAVFVSNSPNTDNTTTAIPIAAPTALKNNDGMLYKMLLVKLTEISFTAGKYKAVAIMNGKYFEMLSKCGKCLL